VVTPYKGRGKLSSHKQADRVHAAFRGPGELLCKLRCSPCKAGHLVKAIAVLHNYQVARG